MSPEIIISAVALLVSIVVAFYSYRQGQKSNEYSKQQTDLQRRVVELEEKRERRKAEDSKKAKFEVKFVEQEDRGRKRKTQLRLVNHGKADAKNVQWKINGVKPSEYQDVLDTDSTIDTYRKIRSGSVEVVKISTTKDSDRLWKIEVQWDDEASTGNQEIFKLNRLQ